MVRDKVLAVVWLAANAAGAWSSRWIPVQGPDHGWALVVLVAITADPGPSRGSSGGASPAEGYAPGRRDHECKFVQRSERVVAVHVVVAPVSGALAFPSVPVRSSVLA